LAVWSIQAAIEILVDSRNGAIEMVSMAVGQGTFAICRREDDVKWQLGVGVRHGEPRGHVSPLTRLESICAS
jgi:hypothetical protein